MNVQKPFIKNAIEHLGFKEFTDVQKQIIPLMRNNDDVIGCSQTGTGKTHAFLIPIFEKIDPNKEEVQVIITTPTRELANQIYKAATHIGDNAKDFIDIRRYVGGRDKNKEIERLQKKQPMIVIGTPGKLHDLALQERVLNIHTARTFIVDEADMTMDQGFLPNVFDLTQALKKDTQLCVFSATIPEQMRPFLRKLMDQPKEVFIAPKQLSNLNIEHIFIPVKSKQPKDVLLQFISTFKPYIALIFCNTKETVDEIADFLYSQGKNVEKLHGDIPARQRKRVMQQANQAKFQYIVASDIASRGIDIDGVSHVINYELPKDMEFYIHRTGRTGRANYDGKAISLYHTDDDAYIDFLEEKGINIVYKEVRNGELVERRDRKERAKRQHVTKGENKNKYNIKKKNKKVKPGYKKKFHKKLQEAKKKAHRKKRRK
ncbi:MAG: DEAD/DEAH box helicase [Candidatus Izemoplasma sp.]|nr:DEAD/DEAH box helicase [Candidatus Izemoplasma sp.]